MSRFTLNTWQRVSNFQVGRRIYERYWRTLCVISSSTVVFFILFNPSLNLSSFTTEKGHVFIQAESDITAKSLPYSFIKNDCMWSLSNDSLSSLRNSCPSTSAYFSKGLERYTCVEDMATRNCQFVVRQRYSCDFNASFLVQTLTALKTKKVMIIGDSHMYNLFVDILCIQEELTGQWTPPIWNGVYLECGNFLFVVSWFLWADYKIKACFLNLKNHSKEFQDKMNNDLSWYEAALVLKDDLYMVILNSGAHWVNIHVCDDIIVSFDRMMERLARLLAKSVFKSIYLESAIPGCSYDDMGKNTWSWGLFFPENQIARKRLIPVGTTIMPVWNLSHETFMNHPSSRGMNRSDCAHYCILERDGFPATLGKMIIEFIGSSMTEHYEFLEPKINMESNESQI